MSKKISFVAVGVGHAKLVQTVFDQIPGYMMRVEGVKRKKGYGRAKLKALPINCPVEKKYCWLVYEGEPDSTRPIGFVDAYKDYPARGTVLLALLLLIESKQGKGLGIAVFKQLCGLFRRQWKSKKIRGGVVMSNPVLGLWQKAGWHMTGEARPFRGEKFDGAIVAIEFPLV